MFNRFCLGVLLLAGLAVPFTGCDTSTGLDSMTVSPSTASMTVGGATLQMTATGTFGNAAHTSSSDITSQTAWTSSSPDIAAVDASTGLVTAEDTGTAVVTGTAAGFNGPVTSSAVITVTGGSGTGPVSSQSLISLTIIPSSITVGNLQDTGNFLAIGTYATEPYVRDVTNSVVWSSSIPNVFPVDTNSGGTTGATAGIVTAYGSGTNDTIIATVTDPVTGSIQYATAGFSCPLVVPCPCEAPDCTATQNDSCPDGPVQGSCYPGTGGLASALLSTITVYNEGLNTTNWEITASSATGTPDVIHCGPGWTLNGGTGGSVCVATYPIGTSVTLTAPAGAGAFGGWSSNCTPVPNPPTAAGPNQCVLTPTTSSETVGAVFN